MSINSLTFTLLLSFFSLISFSQNYWQQEVQYTMDIDFDVEKHQLTGKQKLVYFNNSPDTLHQVFYHLYFNAFQPGSMMDERSRDIADPDKRVGDRIYHLKPNEIGYHKILSLTHNGEKTLYITQGTVLQVSLSKPILPGDSAVFDMEFQSQVPVQIRRSGRNNAEGVDYTMTQWYPKMAAYDKDGWHPDPYVGREFYGVFGTFDVSIHIAQHYKLGGTGVLQNEEAKWQAKTLENGVKAHTLLPHKMSKRKWHFIAKDVHDFAWAADPDFIRTSVEGPDGLALNFFYLDGEWTENWEQLPSYTQGFFTEMNKKFGKYLYPQFSVIQGGDGGMEYPMCTMLKGTGSLEGLVGVMVHESAHNWYYGMLASNEAQYPWMDEGFTSFAEEEVLYILMQKTEANPHAGAYRAYNFLVSKDEVEPLATPADYFDRNRTYGISSYSRGQIFLAQLKNIMGEKDFYKGMLRYYNVWKLKHPEPQDFIKIMEDVSGLQLDWYLNFWMNTTKYIDYAIKEVKPSGRKSMEIVLERLGDMPMPLILTITYKDGSSQKMEIPLLSMYGSGRKDLQAAKPWAWTNRTYSLVLEAPSKEVESIVIDEEGYLADVDRENNIYPAK